MNISLIPTAAAISREALINKSAVVFDILRASSTVCTALASGCKEVIPVVEVADAFTLAKTLPDNSFLLGGERGAVKVPGFHLGNSPLEYTSNAVKDKTVILTTTNGTRATRLAAAGSGQVFIGSLLNVSAVAKQLLEMDRDIVLVCAGTRGKFSLEDTLAAGMVTRQLLKLRQTKGFPSAAQRENLPLNGPVYPDEAPVVASHDLVLEDAVVAALRLAEFYGNNPLRALYDSLHGQKLAQMGLAADLAYCAQVDLLDVAPVYRDGKITVEQP
ncbi:2-phosphosulfolactate phosphatase [Desulforamulus putei]|uniref:Probable 2-phosphosulfolactate phosphatase n=1 Tax=Desulforamulus putei DSM 12395 TaxID=1121429 RepID=A0A1M5AWS8_9FIRM|nr:2-phosphosulfolactate phosphatase [Desulforamulus putei]SHF34698.1 2-phosphosulfolactate phosphatase [Desulforamulus putei DSM 12395]